MIGIIGAMQCEVDAICCYMEDKKEITKFGVNLILGKINNNDCVIALSGVGKVNAAKTTTILCTQFNLDILINVGVAGGLKKNQNPMDVVISNGVIQHDFDTSPIDGEKGLGMKFTCDEQLNELCEKACETLSIISHRGDVASGDIFVTKNNGLKRILDLFPSCVCAEMEAGAIAQIANQFHIRCLIVRALSDIAVKEESHLDFSVFAAKASENAGKITNLLIKNL